MILENPARAEALDFNHHAGWISDGHVVLPAGTALTPSPYVEGAWEAKIPSARGGLETITVINVRPL